MSIQEAEQDFLKIVAEHEMIVLLDGPAPYRHLLFTKHGRQAYSFSITTTPGRLIFGGDMGTWVFERVPDMFQFFRGAEEGPLRINRHYWREKLVACDASAGHPNEPMEFDQKQFNSWVWKGSLALARALKSRGFGRSERETMIDRVKSVRDAGDDGEDNAMRAAYDFSFKGMRLGDVYDMRFRDYTSHYTWACFAIVWAIRQYDKAKSVQPKESDNDAR